MSHPIPQEVEEKLKEFKAKFDGVGDDGAFKKSVEENLWFRQTLLSLSQKKDEEVIICSAVKFNDKVWRGHRHGDALNTMHGELSYTMNRKEMIAARTDEEQGFITSLNRYVGREEAWEIAKKAGQIIEREYQKEGYLFSEDLY